MRVRLSEASGTHAHMLMAVYKISMLVGQLCEIMETLNIGQRSLNRWNNIGSQRS